MSTIVQYTASSLSEYFKIVSVIQNGKRNKNKNGNVIPFWYRGHEFDMGYQLLPSLFRQNENTDFSKNAYGTYSRNHLEEEYRYQHFRAKGSHLLAARVDNSL